ncbi:MAG: ABC transporter substrate-binding protein [Spirochaetaceae bacterium]
MIRNRMRATMLAVVVAGAAALPAAAQDTVSMAIGYIPNIQFAPLYVGMEKGFFAEEDLELEIEYGFGVDVFSLLSLGRIDVGLSDSDQLIIGGTQNLGLKAIFQYYQDYPVSIVALADEIDSPEDLRGKTIGVPETYGTSYIGMQAFLGEYDLADAVTEQRIGYTQISSLVNGRVDAAVTFSNNEPIQLRLQGHDIVEWEVREFSEIVGASIISSDRIINERGDVIERFVRAMRKSMAYTVENQEEAVELSLPYLKDVEDTQVDFIRRSLAATSELFEPADAERAYGSFDASRYRASIRILERIGLIDETYPASRILAEIR